MLHDLILALPSPSPFLAYVALGLSAMIEGPLSILAGGAAASSGLLLPLPVYVSVVAGNLTADLGWYALGRFGRVEWLESICARFRVDRRRIRQVQQGIRKYAPRLIFLAKLTVGFPIPTLIAAGLSRVPPKRWLGMLVLGELLKSAALVGLGYLSARMISKASGPVQAVLWGCTLLLAAAGVLFYCRRKHRPPTPEDASRE